MAESIRQRLPLTGGRIQTSDADVTLDVPAGAFPVDVDVTLEDVRIDEFVSAGGRLVRPIRTVRLEAHGLLGRALPARFARPVRMVMRYGPQDVRWSSGAVSLFTRETPADPWRPLPIVHDPARRTVTADLEHFSDQMLSVDPTRAILPQLDDYQSDLYMGASSVSIPLTVAPGRHGLAPKLVLNYSSTAANSFTSESFVTYQQAQASWVGLGWQLDTGYLEKDNTEGRGRLVLNGRSHQLIRTVHNGQDGRWKSEEDAFLVIRQIEESPGGVAHNYFLVQDKDGTEYRFGYERSDFVSNSGSYYHVDGSRQDSFFFVNWPTSNEVQHRPDRWYLDRVTDTNGNVVEIKYRADDGNDGHHWDKAVYPTEILYTAHPGAGAAATRRVSFITSDQGTRQDAPGLQCEETRYLKEVKAEVLDGGVWRTIRRHVFSYGLSGAQDPGYEDYTGDVDGRRFLVLRWLDEIGEGGLALPRRTFAYQKHEGWRKTSSPEQRGCPLPLLTRVENGYGGATSWTYVNVDWEDFRHGLAPDVSPRTTRHWVVLQRVVEDGVGGVFTTSYGRSAPRWTTKFGQGSSEYTYPIFRGFEVVEVTEPGPTGGADGPKHEHRFFRGLRGRSSPGSTPDAVVTRSDGTTLPDAEPWKGREFEALHKKPDGVVVLSRDWTTTETQSQTDYRSVNESGTPSHLEWWVYHVVTREKLVDRNGQQSKTRWEYDGYGNTTGTEEYADAAQGWTRKTVRGFYPQDQYASGTGTRYVVGKPAYENVLRPAEPNPDGTIWERSTWFLYDGSARYDQPIGSGVDGDDGSFRGRLTRERRFLFLPGESVPKSVDVAYGYDAAGFGNRVAETRFAGYGTVTTLASDGPRTTTTAYDDEHKSFPTIVTKPLAGHADGFEHDPAWGAVRKHWDPNGQLTETRYDGLGRLEWTKGPVVGGAYQRHTKAVHHAPAFGGGRWTTQVEVQRRTDKGAPEAESWHTARKFHDGLGRLVQEQSDAVGGHEVVNRRWDGRGLLLSESAPHLVTGLAGAFAGDDWAADAAPRTRYLYDALKRETQRTLPAQTGQPDVTVEREYTGFTTRIVDQLRHVKDEVRDGLGRLAQVVEHSGTYGATSVYATTGYEYRALDQLKRVVDAAGNETTIAYDRLGRKTGMVDPDMGSWSYAYDAFGNLSSQTDARGTQLTFAYDALNRLATKSGPRSWSGGTVAAGSPIRVGDVTELRAAIAGHYQARGWALPPWTDATITAGVTPIRAVHFNELRERINALRAAAGLGAGGTAEWPVTPTTRIRAQHQSDLRAWLAEYEGSSGGTVGTLATFVYDEGGQPAFAFGRRTSMSDLSGTTSWLYDPYGRVTRTTKTIDGAQYVTDYGYDALDRVRAMTYPDDGGVRETLFYAYGPDTRLVRAWSSLGIDYLTSAVYNALGQPTSLSLNGGAASETRTYFGVDPSYPAGGPFGSTRSIALQAGATVLVSRAHAWDAAGNITQLVDGANGNETTAYGYDHLDRLTSASGGVTESYAYNTIGNTATRNGVGFTYDPAHKHAVSGHAGVSYAYDANGNLTARGSAAFIYDAENRLSRMTSGGNTATFAYDGDGTRVKRSDQFGTVHYAGRHFEKTVGGPATRYYSCTLGKSERLLAFRRGGALRWVGQDHLGSTVRVADQVFAPVDQARYLPFGSDRDPATNLATDQKFTGQVQDASTGLYWYRSRYYDPALTRFAQPDTVVPNYASPQDLNHYSYVRNNPLKYTDPTGHASVPRDDGSARTRITVVERPERGPNITTVVAERLGTLVTTIARGVSGPRITVIQREDRGPYINTDGGFGRHSGIYAAEDGRSAGERGLVWPSGPSEMDEMLGIEGARIPDSEDTPGRSKVQWEPNGEKRGARITYEQHPYDPGYGPHPERHTGPHWHLDNREAPKKSSQQHQTFVEGEPIPGDVIPSSPRDWD